MEFQNDLTEFVSRLTRRLDREPISENRDSLIGAALLGKAIAIEAIQLTTDDVTPESMIESVPKTIGHLLSLGLRTFQKSDAPWEAAINECQLTLVTTVEALTKNQFFEPGAIRSADFREIVSSRIKMLSQSHAVLVEVNGVNEETIAPSVPYAIHQFARINKRLMAHAPSELGWLALSVGRHTSALQRAEWREQTEDGEYDTGIPWTKNDPYSPE
jgi:hypothetical protein